LTDPLLDLLYSYGLLLKYKLIPARTSAVNVMRVMQRVAASSERRKKAPSVVFNSDQWDAS
jgi:hypothetical protein